MMNLLRLSVGLLLIANLSPRSDAQDSNSKLESVSLESLKWLTGDWRCEVDGRLTEETWMAPKGGMMLGLNRSVSATGKASFEYMRIVETGGKLVYLASPGGKEPTAFALKKCDANEVVFENPKHDFPQRIVYRLAGAQLMARVEGTVNGKLKSMDWKWDRAEINVALTKAPGVNQMLHGLRTVIYKVKDLPKAKQWYADVLGFAPYFDEPFYVGFNVGGFELGLDPDVQASTFGSNVAAYWGVDNCRSTYARLLEKGATKHAEPQEVGGGIAVATVLDPFGNVLGVIENPHFKPAESQ